MPLISISCLTDLARAASIMLNRSGESGHSCLVPNLRGKTSNFSLLSAWVMGFSYMVLLCYSNFLQSLVWSLGWEDPLEGGMATHSRILPWRIPINRGAWRAAVPGDTWVGHDWATKHSTAALPPWEVCYVAQRGSVCKNTVLRRCLSWCVFLSCLKPLHTSHPQKAYVYGNMPRKWHQVFFPPRCPYF